MLESWVKAPSGYLSPFSDSQNTEVHSMHAWLTTAWLTTAGSVAGVEMGIQAIRLSMLWNDIWEILVF